MCLERLRIWESLIPLMALFEDDEEEMRPKREYRRRYNHREMTPAVPRAHGYI
ncbi:MAG: hypothetical protein QME78_00015 [Thermodesulfobacteriota bacterium]|nr:hypothetical protein [Thermodesulfobacteriota bacterium]